MSLKKALLLLSVLFYLTLVPVAAQEQETNIFREMLNPEETEMLLQPKAGDYAIYESRFADKHLVISILYLGESNFFLRTFNKNNYDVHEFNISITYQNSSYEIEKTTIDNAFATNSDVLLAQSDFLNIINNRNDINVREFPKDIKQSIEQEQIDTTFVYEYKVWVPLTNLYRRYDANNPLNVLQLIRFGTLKDKNDDTIKTFTGIPLGTDNSPGFIIEEKDDLPVTFDGITIALDKGWTVLEENNTAVYSKDNKRFAHFNILTLSKDKLPPNPYLFFNMQLVNSRAFIIPGSVGYFDFKGTPTLIYTVLNEETLEMTIIINMLYDRGEYTSILNFGSYQNFYLQNRDYFDEIIF